MLRIIKREELIAVNQIVMTLYGGPGIGKTSLGFTADDPILLDFDAGAYRAANRGDSVPCVTWADAASISRDDLANYKTLIVDTAGRALDKLATDIIDRDPKMGYGGALSLQGFGRLKGGFISWLNLVRSFGLDIVLLSHLDEQRKGDDLIERLDAQGSSKNEIAKVSDAMGRLAIRNGKRTLLFSPTDTAFGKNPAQLEPLTVPHFDANSRFLGDVIRQIKASLNTMSSEQQETSAALASWRTEVEAATTPKAMTDLIAAIAKLDSRVRDNAKRVLWEAAKDAGMTYANGAFVEKADEPIQETLPTSTATPAPFGEPTSARKAR